MRDADTAHRAARLGLRLLLAAGFALAAWFAGSLLGNFTASAGESPHRPDPHPAHPAEHGTQPKLLAAVTGTLTGLAGTADHVTNEVAERVSGAVTKPVNSAIEDTVLAVVPALRPVLREPATVAVEPRQEASAPAASSAVAPVTAQAPRPAAGPFRSSNIGQAPVHPLRSPWSSVARSGKPADAVDGQGTTPALPPAGTGGQAIGVTACHDTGSGGKHPLAVLGSSVSRADFRPSGLAVGQHILYDGKNAALPTTSPD